MEEVERKLGKNEMGNGMEIETQYIIKHTGNE